MRKGNRMKSDSSMTEALVVHCFTDKEEHAEEQKEVLNTGVFGLGKTIFALLASIIISSLIIKTYTNSLLTWCAVIIPWVIACVISFIAGQWVGLGGTLIAVSKFASRCELVKENDNAETKEI